MTEINKIEKIKDFLKSGSKAPDSVCYSASEFIIGNALFNCTFYDDMGGVTTNLSFMFIAPSSNFKSPLLDIIHAVYLEEFQEQGMFLKSKFTTEGMMNFLNNYKKKFDEKQEKAPTFKCMVLRDEASNLAKESQGGRASNIWEFYSESFDGTIYPYDTIRGKDQTYPPVWFSYWNNSTLTIFNHLTDDFWEQGFAFRTLFIKPEAIIYKGMHNIEDPKLTAKKIAGEIIELREIFYATATDEWWSKYNKFVAPIFERGNEEIKILESGENLNIELGAEKKYPEMVIKLSMIHCASRRGWKEENGRKYFLLDVQDIENAIKDLKIYKENFIWAYRSYQLKKSETRKRENVGEETKIIFRILENIPPDKKMKIKAEKKENGETIYRAYKDPSGEFVSVSNIYSKIKWNKRTLDPILNTMEMAEEIEIIQARTNNKTYKPSTLIRDIRGKNVYDPDQEKPTTLIPSVDISKLPPELRKKLGK